METKPINNYDYQEHRHVGWDASKQNNAMDFLFSEQNIRYLSSKITEMLDGVDPTGKSIIVTDRVISGVLSSIAGNHSRGNIGDIHSRYIIPQEPECHVTSIIERTIETIVNHIKSEIDTEKCNESLSIWNSIRGGQNELGLMPHPKIKLQERRPQHMAFNMNY